MANLWKKATASLLTAALLSGGTPGPVSYTHLDVYKRQGKKVGSMKSVISIGNQDFISIRENHCFYIDKTDFIRE